MSVTFEQASPIDRPTDTGDLACEVCGAPLHYSGRGPKPKYCADHRTASSRNQGSSSDGAKRTGAGGKKGATEDTWGKFLRILLVASTYAIGRYAAGGVGISLECPPHADPRAFEALNEALTMDPDEEARPIAALLAKNITPTSFNKKHGHYVVQALEYEEAGAALFSYGKRIAPILAARMKGNTIVPPGQDQPQSRPPSAPIRSIHVPPPQAQPERTPFDESQEQDGSSTGARSAHAEWLARQRAAGHVVDPATIPG